MNISVTAETKQLVEAMNKAPKVVFTKIQSWVERSGGRAERVAKEEVPVDQGPLQSSIRMKLGSLKAEVAPHKEYALAVHEGTGIYGKNKRPITAKNGKMLRFEVGGNIIYTHSVKGQRPNPYMKRAFESVKPSIERDASNTLDQIVSSL